jgi:hypothetical protein
MESYVVNSSFLVIGFVAGWILSQLKVKAEIGKLKAEKKKLEVEAIKFAGENLTKWEERTQSYNEAYENCKQIGIELTNDLKNQSVNVVGTRERFCTAFYSNVIPSYIKLIRRELLYAQSDQDSIKTLISEDVICELRHFRDWLTILNNSRFLDDMGLSPAKISKRTLRPFLQLLKELPRKDRSCVEIMLKKVIDEIVEEGLKK